MPWRSVSTFASSAGSVSTSTALSAASASSRRPSLQASAARISAASDGVGSSFSKNARTWPSGCAPMNCATGRPFLNAMTLGMDLMPKVADSSWFWSESTFTSLTRPS